MGKGYLKYPMRSQQRDVGLAFVAFDTNDTGAPDGLVSDEDLVATFARTGVGTFLLTLRHQYLQCRGFAEIEDTTAGHIVKAVSHVEGQLAANSVGIQVEDEAGNAKETNNTTINVWLFLKQN
jgi:hypothetical protein